MKGCAATLEPYNEITGVARLADLVVERADERPGAPFLHDAADGYTVTFDTLADRVHGLRGVLDGHTAPGEPIGLAVSRPVDYAVALLGVVAAGRRCVPLDPQAPAGDLLRTLGATGSTLVLGDRDLMPDAPQIRVLDPQTPRAPRPATSAGPGALVLATSGSTGEPKVVQLDEAQLLYVAGCIATHNELTGADVGYCTLPLFHVNAEVVALLASLLAGASLTLRSRFSRREFWSDLDRAGATWVNAVPAILAILATEQPPALPALRFVRSASAALPGPTRQRVETVFGVPVVDSYGMTEAASQITAAPLDGSGPLGSAGRPVGVELQVRRPDGSLAGTGEVGHVWIHGPGVITAYVGGRAADRFDRDGWLDTADLGHVDADGFLFLVGRSDDVINRGGEMVYPAGIEQLLLADPRVREAVVVAAPHDILGSMPEAFVIAAEDTDAAELTRDLEHRCTVELARASRPQAVHVVAELPRAATGKIVRREIRARLDGASRS